MKFLDALARQPKWLIWVWAVLVLSVVGLIDLVTPWSFGLFMFYAFAIFGIAWTLGLRHAIPYAAGCLVVSWFANLSSYPFADLRGYAWSAANRSVAFLFVAACGNAIRSYRDESRARVQAIEHARRLEQEMLRTAESEQRRIGQDLHDSVCQSLSAINIALELLKGEVRNDEVTQAAQLRQIQEMVRDAGTEVRNLARTLAPAHVTEDGLSEAIASLVLRMNHLLKSEIIFRADDDIRVPDPTMRINLYRITQEALNNAVKHAHASHVTVNLKRHDGGLALSISDDGCGLPAGAAKSGGMGLQTMAYRANLIGATFSLAGNESGGVSVKCFLRGLPAA